MRFIYYAFIYNKKMVYKEKFLFTTNLFIIKREQLIIIINYLDKDEINQPNKILC